MELILPLAFLGTLGRESLAGGITGLFVEWRKWGPRALAREPNPSEPGGEGDGLGFANAVAMAAGRVTWRPVV